MWKQEDRMGRAKAVKVEQDRQERTEAEIRRRVKIEEYQRDRVCNEKYGRGGFIDEEKMVGSDCTHAVAFVQNRVFLT